MLVLLAAVDRLGLRIFGRSGLPWFRGGHRLASAAGFDDLQAAFHSGNRHTIERRKLELVLRDDEHGGAPLRVGIDLDAGRAVISRTGSGPSADA